MLPLFSILAFTQSGVAQPHTPPEPVVIVDDAAAIRRAVGGRVETVFTPTRDEAEAPRKDLPRYLAAERKREKDGYRRTQLHQIEAAIDRYFWHCGGYVKGKQRYLYCSFVRKEDKKLDTIYVAGALQVWIDSAPSMWTRLKDNLGRFAKESGATLQYFQFDDSKIATVDIFVTKGGGEVHQGGRGGGRRPRRGVPTLKAAATA